MPESPQFTSAHMPESDSLVACISPSASLSTSLAYLNSKSSPKAQDLYHLQVNLDRRCLQAAEDAAAEPDNYVENETAEINSAVDLAVYLSGTLCIATYPGSFLFQEVKSRATLACLTLLRCYRVTALHSEQWGRLHRADFQQIAFHAKSNKTLWERIRYAPNPYLAQMISLSL